MTGLNSLSLFGRWEAGGRCADADIKGLLECMDDSTAYDFPTHAAEQTRMEIEAAIAKAEARE